MWKKAARVDLSRERRTYFTVQRERTHLRLLVDLGKLAEALWALVKRVVIQPAVAAARTFDPDWSRAHQETRLTANAGTPRTRRAGGETCSPLWTERSLLRSECRVSQFQVIHRDFNETHCVGSEDEA